MQECLNDEARHASRQYKKYPALWLLSFLYLALCASLITLAFLCNTTYPCSYSQQNTMLWFGLMLLVSLVMFVIVPSLLRCCLNCLFIRPRVDTVKKMSPLNIPKPPSTPPPKHALKSFREFTQSV